MIKIFYFITILLLIFVRPIKSFYRSMFPSMNQITSKIYIGNWCDSTNWTAIKKEKITHVLTLNKKRKHSQKQFTDNNIKYLYIDILDEPYVNISQHFTTCFNFIDSSNKILINCTAGVSRSSTIVIAYLIKNGMRFNDALLLVKNKRPRISPNIGFLKQLKEFESLIMFNLV